jgi:hypothetical protein
MPWVSRQNTEIRAVPNSVVYEKRIKKQTLVNLLLQTCGKVYDKSM